MKLTKDELCEFLDGNGWDSIDDLAEAIIEANDAKLEPARTTMSCGESCADFFENPNPKNNAQSVYEAGWNAALEHSVELIEAKNRIEELEGFVADAANDAEGWAISIEQLRAVRGENEQVLANNFQLQKAYEQLRAQLADKPKPDNLSLRAIVDRFDVYCGKQTLDGQWISLETYRSDLVKVILAAYGSPQQQNPPSILDLEKGQSAIDHLKSALELLEGEKK